MSIGKVELVGKAGFVLIMSILICTCAKKPDPVPKYTYETQGIQIRYNADNMLNAYEDKPHTLLLVVYQLTSVDAFNSQAKSENGLINLLQAKSFDKSVKAASKFIVQPGNMKSLVLNRAGEAEWVGIVAGYYELVPGRVNRIFRIPVRIEKKGIIIISRKKEAVVGHLLINLFLGPHSMHEVDSN